MAKEVTREQADRKKAQAAVIGDFSHEVPNGLGGFDRPLFGFEVKIHTPRTFSYQSRLHECRTEFQFGIDKVNERPLCPSATRFVRQHT
jgi:hypothetical protein